MRAVALKLTSLPQTIPRAVTRSDISKGLKRRMAREYRRNHYVPEWYQKRFIPPGQKENELFYLDLRPGVFVDPRGVSHAKRALKRQGFKYCFAETDLYTRRFGSLEVTDIERVFFGAIDRNGRKAVDYFTTFEHPSVDDKAFQNMMRYLSTQKLRTPKGLGWLGDQLRTHDQRKVLEAMIYLQQLYGAIWTECVWLIADAIESDTKFIISDHPVTLYNRRCGPRSQWCRGYNDPDIAFNGTHTVFPLSLEKILILTNLSWVRNPYQKETSARPNPKPFRAAMFKFTEIQTLRHLSEQEVRQINFIIKARCLRYVAAAKEEWLYPERHVSKSDWYDFGRGYLLMPDPRPLSGGGTVIWGGGAGPGGAMDEYGRLPWQAGFEQESKAGKEFEKLQRFKGEFAHLFGPRRRGRTFEFGNLDPEEDSADFHKYHLGLYKRGRG